MESAVIKLIDATIDDDDFTALHRMFEIPKIFEIGISRIRVKCLDEYLQYTFWCYTDHSCKGCKAKFIFFIDNFIKKQNFDYLIEFGRKQSQWLRSIYFNLVAKRFQKISPESHLRYLEHIANYTVKKYKSTLSENEKDGKSEKVKLFEKELLAIINKVVTKH